MSRFTPDNAAIRDVARQAYVDHTGQAGAANASGGKRFSSVGSAERKGSGIGIVVEAMIGSEEIVSET